MDAGHSQSLLTINSGSSSLKFALFAAHDPHSPKCLYRGEITAIGGVGRFHVHDRHGVLLQTHEVAVNDHQQALQPLLAWLSAETAAPELLGVGHRVVHGGRRFRQPARITEDVLVYLQSLSTLAPNHQPPCLSGIRTLQRLRPQLPQIACFDTAFHHQRPSVERRFALPAWPELDEVHRYGFHGLSYEYIAKTLPDHLGSAADGRIIVAHLGHGASLCALHERRSIATTMTFTPLDGIPMGTRCGAIDPAVVLYLLQQGMPAERISDLLYFKSGLLGISGESSDMATLLQSASMPAQQAIEQFVHHTVRAIGSLAAALGGVDALIFTAGIGEHAAPIRAAIGNGCEWLGLRLDDEANRLGRSRISRDDSAVSAWIITTDEERMIAEHSLHILNRQDRHQH